MKYLGTISTTEWSYAAVKRVLRGLDVHEYVIGREVGRNGYEHYQVAIDCAGDLLHYNDGNHCGWHLEVCKDWRKSCNYCRKEGNFHEFSDRFEFREYTRIRKRKATEFQCYIDKSLQNNDDRAIIFWIDHRGSRGKSTWLYLNERRGQVFSIPRDGQTSKGVIDFIAQQYDDEPVICLDLPRKAVVSESLCNTLEQVKDGQISSAKYQGAKKFIRGVKVLVFTNHRIPAAVFKSLTRDRWDTWEVWDDGRLEHNGEPIDLIG